MVIKFARIRFDDETTKYYIKPITDIKKNENDDEKQHITPQDENDFDSKHTYYCKFMLCKGTCVVNHKHYEYYPCRVFLLGASAKIIDEKVKEKRCSIPKLTNDLGVLRSNNNDNISKVKEANKNAKIQKSNVKRKRNQTILDALAGMFEDTDDSQSECSVTSQHSKESERLRPVSVRLEKLNTLIASQPSKSTSQQSSQSRFFHNVDGNLSEVSHTDDESNYSLEINKTVLSEPSKKKFKRAVHVNSFQNIQDQWSNKLTNKSPLMRKSLENESQLHNGTSGNNQENENYTIESTVAQENGNHVHSEQDTINDKVFEDVTVENGAATGDDVNVENGTANGEDVTAENGAATGDDVNVENGTANGEDVTAENGAATDDDGATGNGVAVDGDGTAGNHQAGDDNGIAAGGETIEDNHRNGIGGQNIVPPNPEIELNDGRQADVVSDEENEEGNNQNQANKKIIKMKQFVLNSIKYYKAGEGHGFDEKQRRYTISNNGEIYLGENISVQPLEWDMANLERPTIFLVLVAQMLWHPHDLANRALEITDDMRNIPDRSPIKLIETNLLRLLISLYHDYLKRDKCMSNETKASYLLKVTYTLRNKIKNLRTQEKKAKATRNIPNARKRLRYNNIE